jgi:hypothetical protein
MENLKYMKSKHHAWIFSVAGAILSFVAKYIKVPFDYIYVFSMKNENGGQLFDANALLKDICMYVSLSLIIFSLYIWLRKDPDEELHKEIHEIGK